MERGRKREWVVPQLVVVARATPEESVLRSCKWTVIIGSTRLTNSCINKGLQPCQQLISS